MVVVFARQVLEANACFFIPSVNMKFHTIFSKHDVSLNGVAAAAEETGKVGAPFKFTECVAHQITFEKTVNESASGHHGRCNTPESYRAVREYANATGFCGEKRCKSLAGLEYAFLTKIYRFHLFAFWKNGCLRYSEGELLQIKVFGWRMVKCLTGSMKLVKNSF